MGTNNKLEIPGIYKFIFNEKSNSKQDKENKNQSALDLNGQVQVKTNRVVVRW